MWVIYGVCIYAYFLRLCISHIYSVKMMYIHLYVTMIACFLYCTIQLTIAGTSEDSGKQKQHAMNLYWPLVLLLFYTDCNHFSDGIL